MEPVHIPITDELDLHTFAAAEIEPLLSARKKGPSPRPHHPVPAKPEERKANE
ncbi:MAG: hypothetical protein SWH68_05010 [Thermodesulfobacteriota bacterium]|nr:hypothetical protein [Thermodesulfobacteriota bacterium]